MKPATRRTFLAIVFTSVMATAAEAWAGIFRRCRLRRRRTSCQCSCTPCETSTKAAAPADGQRGDCKDMVCLQALEVEVQNVNGECVSRQYSAQKCLGGGNYDLVYVEKDCSDPGPLPQGDCSNAQACSSCGLASGSIEVAVLPGDDDRPPAGKRHRADKGLATNGTDRMGSDCKIVQGGNVGRWETVEIFDDSGATNPPRLARLAWIALKNGDRVGLGFEVAEGTPTLYKPDVKQQALLTGNGKKYSYTVSAKSEGKWRHFAVYMKR